MRRSLILIAVGAVLSAAIGCGSKAEDDGLKLTNNPPPIDQAAPGAKPPEAANPKGGNGEGS